MTRHGHHRVMAMRWAGWASLLIAALVALVLLTSETGLENVTPTTAKWVAAGIVLVLGGGSLLLCRAVAALISTRQEADTPVRESPGGVRGAGDHEQAVAAGRQPGRFLQDVIDGTPDPLLVIDRDFRVILANRAAQTMTGEGAGGGDNGYCYALSHGRDKPCCGTEHPCPLADVVAAKAPVTVTHTHFDSEGNEVIAEISASPIVDESGKVTAIIELCRDITARVRAEERVRQHQADLAHVARVGTMGEMATGLAHELNQPLAAIVNYLQACLERIKAGVHDPGELLEDVQRASVQAQRAGEMVDHLRDFVRRHEPDHLSVDLNALVRDAVDLVRPELRSLNVQVSMDLADDLPAVQGQAIQIEQTVVNLIRNGLEAMGDDEHGPRRLAVLTSCASGDAVELVIRDTGRGLSEDEFARLFEPFFTTKPEGMGLGLSISKTIIEAHGGRLWASRNLDRGATFGFTLPISEGGSADGC